MIGTVDELLDRLVGSGSGSLTLAGSQQQPEPQPQLPDHRWHRNQEEEPILVVGVVGQRGPHLLSVDDPLVAVEHGPAPQPGEVRPRVGFGVALTEEDLAGELLAASRLLTLTGAPGSGKTRLALRLADEQAGEMTLDVEAARAMVGPETAAIMIEPIQGEGGVRIPDAEFLSGLRRLLKWPMAISSWIMAAGKNHCPVLRVIIKRNVILWKPRRRSKSIWITAISCAASATSDS